MSLFYEKESPKSLVFYCLKNAKEFQEPFVSFFHEKSISETHGVLFFDERERISKANLFLKHVK